jgi:D-tyrosyl-tRNA(Tyr) deacylase
MRAVVQRVASARVVVSGTTAGAIGAGLCVLLGVALEDTAAHSLLDAGGDALVVSQFTLIADTAKGNRPSFSEAAAPEQAEPLYDRFCAALRELGVPVETGVFGAKMQVELVNEGPVTIILDV